MRKLATVVLSDSECPAIHLACVSPRGDLVIGAGGVMAEAGWVSAWDTQTAERIWSWKAGASAVTTLAISRDQRVLATAGQVTDSIEVWDVASQTSSVLKLFSPPYRRTAAGLAQTSTHVSMIAFSHDAKLLAAGCWDMSAKIWDLESGSLTEFLQPHQSNVDFVAFRPDDKSLISGTYQSLFVWNIDGGTCEQKIDLPSDDVWQHSFLEAQDRVASVSRNGTIRLWNPADWSYREFHVKSDRAITCLANCPRLKQLAIGLENGEVVFLDTVEGRFLGRWRIGRDPINSLSYAPVENAIWTVTAASRKRFQLHRFITERMPDEG